MAKLIYSMITSLDGYAEAAEGDLGAGAEVEEVHTFIGDRFRFVGTYLYGRRMYETMVFWETAHTEPDAPPHIVQYAVRLAGRGEGRVLHDAGVGVQREDQDRADLRPRRGAQAQGRGRSRPVRRRPEPRRAAIAAGLVDEYHLFITSSVVGAGKRFFPDGVRLDLELVEERSFDSGLIYADPQRHAVKPHGRELWRAMRSAKGPGLASSSRPVLRDAGRRRSPPRGRPTRWSRAGGR